MNVKKINAYKIEIDKDSFVIFFANGKTVDVFAGNNITGDFKFQFSFEINGESEKDIIEMVKNSIKNGYIIFFD